MAEYDPIWSYGEIRNSINPTDKEPEWSYGMIYGYLIWEFTEGIILNGLFLDGANLE